MNGYTETILKYASDDRYVGLLPDAHGIGEVGLGSEEAGRRLAVRFSLKLSGTLVSDARFQVFGCGFTIAACAAAADLVVGCRLAEVSAIDAGQIDAALNGLPPERGYCAELAVEALQAAAKSANNSSQPVQTGLKETSGHGPLVTPDQPLYRQLLASPQPESVSAEDRHLFACLLAVTAAQPFATAPALGLLGEELSDLLRSFFPGVALPKTPKSQPVPPPINRDIRGLLLGYALQAGGPHAVWLAKIIAARAAHPGHLWVAMGLFERPQLSAAIRRHLPGLAAANSNNMRWKRFLFKQVCDLNGGSLCKTPSCGDCSDYSLCFAPEGE